MKSGGPEQFTLRVHGARSPPLFNELGHKRSLGTLKFFAENQETAGAFCAGLTHRFNKTFWNFGHSVLLL